VISADWFVLLAGWWHRLAGKTGKTSIITSLRLCAKSAFQDMLNVAAVLALGENHTAELSSVLRPLLDAEPPCAALHAAFAAVERTRLQSLRHSLVAQRTTLCALMHTGALRVSLSVYLSLSV